MNRYEKLEGKKIEYNMGYGNILQGIVTGCEPAIGVSVEEVGLPTGDHRYLICLNGPSSPEFLSCYAETYEGLFDCIVKQLKTGSYTVGRCDDLAPINRDNNVQSCPFSQ